VKAFTSLRNYVRQPYATKQEFLNIIRKLKAGFLKSELHDDQHSNVVFLRYQTWMDSCLANESFCKLLQERYPADSVKLKAIASRMNNADTG
jgi:hypothetical protein